MLMFWLQVLAAIPAGIGGVLLGHWIADRIRP